MKGEKAQVVIKRRNYKNEASVMMEEERGSSDGERGRAVPQS